MAEAANIKYISHNTTIPIPWIQDIFIIEHKTYIVMDYINTFLCPNPLEIELTNESGMGESVQTTEATGTQWILNSSVLSWCMLLASDSCNEFGLESVESF
jgi:hypothetical protein